MNLDSNQWDDDMMDDVFGETASPKKLVVVLMDASGSMEGTVIGTVNSIMEELTADMEGAKDQSELYVVSFGEEVLHSGDKPQEAARFGGWRRVRASHFSALGQACQELAQRMAASGFFPDTEGSKASFLLFSDGLVTDAYEEGLAQLQSQPLFQKGRKLAACFSEYYEEKVLRAFTGDPERVLLFTAKDTTKAKKQIQAFVNG